MLALHGDVIREYARRYLGEVPDDVVEATVKRTVARLLEIPCPSIAHGLRYATLSLGRECAHMKRVLVEGGVPVDRRLGPLTGSVARALEKMGPRAQALIRLAAEGKSSTELADMYSTSPQAIRIRLHHARNRVEKLMGRGSASASALLGVVGDGVRRLRQRATDWRYGASPLTAWPGEPLAHIVAASLIGMTLIGSGAFPSTPLAVASGRGHEVLRRSADASAPFSSPGSIPVRAAAQAPMSQRRGSKITEAVRPAPPSTPLDLGNRVPGGETPEDAQLIAAAVPLDYAGSHTIVALGLGRGCGCSVLFQSTDGGANWVASPASPPPSAEQLVLPPTYPRDPRIFIGTNPQTGGAVFVASSFTASPQPLPAPAGHVALAAGFGRGDDRLFVAAQGEVSYIAANAAPATAVPVLVYPNWLVSTATVATAWDGDHSAVLVLAPPGTAAVDEPLGGETQAPAIFACGVGQSCVQRGTPPTTATALQLAASPSDAIAAVSWASGLAISLDAGRSFGPATLPQPGAVLAGTATTGQRAWVLLLRGSRTAVLWSRSGQSGWTDVTHFGDGLERSLTLVAIPGGPILDFLQGTGLRCSDDGGTTWASRCL